MSLCAMAPKLWPHRIRQRESRATRKSSNIKRQQDPSVNLEFKMGSHMFDPEFSPWGPQICAFSVDSYHLTGDMFTNVFNDDINFDSEKLTETHPVGAYWVWCVGLPMGSDVFPPLRVFHFYVVDYEHGMILGGPSNTWIPTMRASEMHLYFNDRFEDF
jgi:hypothetical protein